MVAVRDFQAWAHYNALAAEKQDLVLLAIPIDVLDVTATLALGGDIRPEPD